MAREPFTDFEFNDAAATGVKWCDLVTAIGIWTYCNEDRETPTVAAAALAFNTTPEIIRGAVGGHPWLFMSGPDDDPTKQTIESDGE